MDIYLPRHIKRSGLLRRFLQIFDREYYYVYVATNDVGTAIFTGVTDSMDRTQEQWAALRLETRDMTSNKYLCNYVLYSERFKTIQQALQKKAEIEELYRDYGDNLMCDIVSEPF